MVPLGHANLFNRSVYLIEAQDITSVRIQQGTLDNCFVCFVALDAATMLTESIYHFAQSMLQAKCVYFCIWGPACERVLDIVDEAVVGKEPPASVWEGIMTTSHSDESLADALEYFCTCTLPDDRFVSCDAALIISTASQVESVKSLTRKYLQLDAQQDAPPAVR